MENLCLGIQTNSNFCSFVIFFKFKINSNSSTFCGKIVIPHSSKLKRKTFCVGNVSQDNQEVHKSRHESQLKALSPQEDATSSGIGPGGGGAVVDLGGQQKGQGEQEMENFYPTWKIKGNVTLNTKLENNKGLKYCRGHSLYLFSTYSTYDGPLAEFLFFPLFISYPIFP